MLARSTYTIAPHAFEVRNFRQHIVIPWQAITAFGVGTNEYLSHLLVLHVMPGKPKLETFNVDLGDVGTRELVAALQARVPHAFRGTLPLLQLRKAMGISNVGVTLIAIAMIIGVLAIIVVVSGMMRR